VQRETQQFTRLLKRRSSKAETGLLELPPIPIELSQRTLIEGLAVQGTLAGLLRLPSQ
jgi:hypothetical protein